MKHILSYMRRAIEDYDMIEAGDKIAVALSGGKDSITMLNGLKSLQYFYTILARLFLKTDKNKIHVLYVLICVGVFLTLLQNVNIATRLH